MRGELELAKLTHDSEALPLYGLLTALLRPSCVIELDEDMRCSPCSNFVRLLFFGGSIGIAWDRSMGVDDTSSISKVTD